MTIYRTIIPIAVSGGIVDKRFLLKTLYETGSSALLSGEELRLYVLFLAAAGTNGRGFLPYGVIEEALGPIHPPGRLTFMCRRLEELGLIHLHGTSAITAGVGYCLKEPVPVTHDAPMEPKSGAGNGDPHDTQ